CTRFGEYHRSRAPVAAAERVRPLGQTANVILCAAARSLVRECVHHYLPRSVESSPYDPASRRNSSVACRTVRETTTRTSGPGPALRRWAAGSRAIGIIA